MGFGVLEEDFEAAGLVLECGIVDKSETKLVMDLEDVDVWRML